MTTQSAKITMKPLVSHTVTKEVPLTPHQNYSISYPQNSKRTYTDDEHVASGQLEDAHGATDVTDGVSEEHQVHRHDARRGVVLVQLVLHVLLQRGEVQDVLVDLVGVEEVTCGLRCSQLPRLHERKI